MRKNPGLCPKQELYTSPDNRALNSPMVDNKNKTLI